MKINKLEVLGYGKWRDVSFDFNDDNLQIIFGNNEAGKTTLLSLIKGILFGMSMDAEVHMNNIFRVTLNHMVGN